MYKILRLVKDIDFKKRNVKWLSSVFKDVSKLTRGNTT
jgi:hypothetical protein